MVQNACNFLIHSCEVCSHTQPRSLSGALALLRTYPHTRMTMHEDDRGRTDTVTVEDMAATPTPGLLRRFLRLLTFVDLPIKQKFLLLAIGTLFWFGSMAVVTVFALTAIQYKYHLVSEQIMPHDLAAREVLSTCKTSTATCSSSARPIRAPICSPSSRCATTSRRSAPSMRA